MKISEFLYIFDTSETTLEAIQDRMSHLQVATISRRDAGFEHTLYIYKRYSEAYKRLREFNPDAVVPDMCLIMDMSGKNKFGGNGVNRLQEIKEIESYAQNGGVIYIILKSEGFPTVWGV